MNADAWTTVPRGWTTPSRSYSLPHTFCSMKTWLAFTAHMFYWTQTLKTPNVCWACVKLYLVLGDWKESQAKFLYLWKLNYLVSKYEL